MLYHIQIKYVIYIYSLLFPDFRPKRNKGPCIGATTSLNRANRPFIIKFSRRSWQNEWEVYDALQKTNPHLRFRLRESQKGQLLLTALDEETITALNTISDIDNKPVKFIQLNHQEKRHTLVAADIPNEMSDTELMKRDKRIIKIKRLTRRRTEGIVTTIKVIVECQEKPEFICDGCYKVRTFVPTPVKCYRCKGYGHMVRSCRFTESCGVGAKGDGIRPRRYTI